MNKSQLTLFFISLLFGVIFSFSPSFSQQFKASQFSNASSLSNHQNHTEKCAHEVLEAKIEKEVGYFASKPYFENWINEKIEARRNSPQVLSRTNETSIKIPVVVHVLHSGSPIGEGANIPTSQILEQIRVLNEDFNRENIDAINTPEEFLSAAGVANIEFVLALQDEQGLPTDGIVRVQGPKSIYSPDDAVLVGQTSQWNPEEYLNIWVMELVQPFIGYASFPISDLPGLNFPPVAGITDGVTVDYRFFGIGGSAISASLGRTTTHEVGHYLGLRHIWGDGGCGVDDFVEDTPLQDNPNNTCNANPSRFSCESNDMIQNYMDYTPDACMNIFTKGQIERFNVVLENSPRRISLVNNRATEEPQLEDIDLGISRIIEPGNFACSPTVNPSIEVINTGNELLTSSVIEILRNGVLIESKNFDLLLNTGESTTLDFSSFDLLPISNEIKFTIIQVNGTTDNNPDNNELTTNPVIQVDVDLPYTYDLNSFPGQWTLENPDDLFTWDTTSLTIDGQEEEAIFIRHYEYEARGQLDYLISPRINLSEYPNAQLVFELAHGPYDQPGFADALFVAVSEDCGDNFDLVNASYQKTGTRLETSNPTLDEFIPFSSSQFRTELVNLSQYKDLGSVRLAFITENGYGNNIYIKNVRILPNEEFNYSLEIEELIAPNPVVDGTQSDEAVLFRNTGNLPVTSFLFSRSTNGSNIETFVANGSTALPGDTFRLSGQRTTREGKNQMDFSVFDPNFDQNGNNGNEFRRYIIEDAQIITAPWRQNFNNLANTSNWQSLSPEEDLESWRVISSTGGEGNNNLLALTDPIPGNSYWYASPLFDLTSSRQASLFFDLASGEVSEGTVLRLLASTNGGEDYSEVWAALGNDLSTVSSGEANPNNVNDFARKFVNLSEFAGSGNSEVRIAFVLEGVSEGDSPVYLDNLELFLSANPNPVIPGEGTSILYPNPAREAFNLAFNVPLYETVNIQIISSTGAIIQDIDYPQTLNQTYSFSTELFRSGVYILKITSDSVQETKRLIIN